MKTIALFKTCALGDSISPAMESYEKTYQQLSTDFKEKYECQEINPHWDNGNENFQDGIIGSTAGVSVFKLKDAYIENRFMSQGLFCGGYIHEIAIVGPLDLVNDIHFRVRSPSLWYGTEKFEHTRVLYEFSKDIKMEDILKEPTEKSPLTALEDVLTAIKKPKDIKNV